VHVLRGTHESLEPGGLVLDVHPVPPDGRISACGRTLGRLDESEFFDTVRATEAGMQAAVDHGLFAFETELEREIIERFADAAELVETAEEWGDIRIPEPVMRRLASAPGPIDFAERVVFRRFRAT
jgi:hypothetical protein